MVELHSILQSKVARQLPATSVPLHQAV